MSKSVARREVVAPIVAMLVWLALAAIVMGGCSSTTSQGAKYERDGDYQKAASLYKDYLQNHPNSADVIAALGSDLYILGQYDQALPYQEKTVKNNPKDAQTRVELAFNYLNHQSRPADAVKVLQEAVAIDGSAKYLTFLAQALETTGDDANAIVRLREAIAKDPKYGHSYMVLYSLLGELGRTAEAAQVKADAAQHGVTVGQTK